MLDSRSIMGFTGDGGRAESATTTTSPLNGSRRSPGLNPDKNPLGGSGTRNVSGRAPAGPSGKGGDTSPNKPERTTTNQGRNPLRLR